MNIKISKLELRRALFHLVWGFVIILLLQAGFLAKWSLLVLLAFSIVLSCICREHKIPLVYWFLEKFERKEHIREFPGKGALFYLVGVTIVVFLFPRDIALAAIAILAAADPFSRLIGMRFGKIKHPFNDTKFMEGAIAGIITGYLAGILFVNSAEAFFAALFAMVAEGIEIKLGWAKVDDNIVIPVVAGSVIWLIRIFAGL